MFYSKVFIKYNISTIKLYIRLHRSTVWLTTLLLIIYIWQSLLNNLDSHSTLLRPKEFSIKFDAVKSVFSFIHEYIKGPQVMISKINIKIAFVFAASAE